MINIINLIFIFFLKNVDFNVLLVSNTMLNVKFAKEIESTLKYVSVPIKNLMITRLLHVKIVFFNAIIVLEMHIIAQLVLIICLDLFRVYVIARMEETIVIQAGAVIVQMQL